MRKFKEGDIVEYRGAPCPFFTPGNLYEVWISPIGPGKDYLITISEDDLGDSFSEYAHAFRLVDSELAKVVLGGGE